MRFQWRLGRALRWQVLSVLVGLGAAIGVTPPARAQGAACIGDCDGNGEVTVAELLQAVNIALDNAPVDECSAVDASGEGTVTVDEILTAVNNTLNGCPPMSPTPSPTLGVSASPTPSATPPITLTLTPTGTPSASASPTVTATRTGTASAPPSVTRTPTVTVTPTPTSKGPQITFFGLATADNFVVPTPSATDAQGNPVYNRPVGAGFLIVVEAMPGGSGVPPGTKSFNSNDKDPKTRPDLQIQANRDLGNGSPAVCDKAGPGAMQTPGGVPAVPTPNFDLQLQTIANALNDLGCRFDVHSSDDACTKPNRLTEVPAFVNPDSTNQFCTAAVVGAEWEFHSGDTLLTVQWRDGDGNIGNPARIVVHVP